MQLSSILAILPIAAVALAAPGKPSKPSKPEKPAAPHSPQYNFCGNGVTPYCCNNEAAYGGSASCTALGKSFYPQSFYTTVRKWC